ncbi:MAG: hypothetical protein H0V44_02530 [Planctomycetes bacterium]|nr:hypothetical protein [Planctomycetota bacterium]
MAVSQTIPDQCPSCGAELESVDIRDRPAARVLKVAAFVAMIVVTVAVLAIASATGLLGDGIQPIHVVLAGCVSLIPAGIMYRAGASMKKVKLVTCDACPWKGHFAIRSHETIRLMADA